MSLFALQRAEPCRGRTTWQVWVTPCLPAPASGRAVYRWSGPECGSPATPLGACPLHTELNLPASAVALVSRGVYSDRVEQWCVVATEKVRPCL